MKIDEAKSIATLSGYTLLDTEWKGVKYKYTFLSYYGITWISSFDNFKRGKRCSKDKVIQFFINIIKPAFESRDYEILLDPIEYIDQFQMFYFKCNLGILYETCWNNVSRGIFNTFDKKYGSYKELKNYIFCRGGRILQPWYSYVDVDTPVRYRCANGHISYLTLSSARAGHWCLQCHKEQRKSLLIHKNDLALYDTLSYKLELYGEKTTIIYNDNLKLLGVLCKECGKVHHPGRRKAYERLLSAGNKRRGNSYFYCSDECKYLNKYYNNLKESSFEKNVLDFIHTFFVGSVEQNNRSIITNPYTNKQLELDFYFPECRKAIECNGMYWHSKEHVKVRDKLKLKLCKNLDIELLVIYEQLWYNERHVQQDVIYKFLN